MPDEFVRHYPSVPLQVRAGIDGSLNNLRLTALSLTLPGAIRAEASGEMFFHLIVCGAMVCCIWRHKPGTLVF